MPFFLVRRELLKRARAATRVRLVVAEESEDEDAYLEKSANAERMGKAVEYLVAAACILSTRGELNVSTSMVDDEGVDLVFHRRESAATLVTRPGDGHPLAAPAPACLTRRPPCRNAPIRDPATTSIPGRRPTSSPARHR